MHCGAALFSLAHARDRYTAQAQEQHVLSSDCTLATSSAIVEVSSTRQLSLASAVPTPALQLPSSTTAAPTRTSFPPNTGSSGQPRTAAAPSGSSMMRSHRFCSHCADGWPSEEGRHMTSSRSLQATQQRVRYG